jgi:uncharacterized protein YjcR
MRGVHGKAMHLPNPPAAEDVSAAENPGREAWTAMRRMARSLYWRGWTVAQISAEYGIPYQTIGSWKRRDKWASAAPVDVVEDRLEAKIATLLDKEPFTEGDMKRVDFLMRQMERAARIRKFEETGKEGDLNPNIARRNDDAAKAKREEKRKNQLSREQWQALLDDFHEKNFGHQRAWWDQRDHRTRKILKSRQIGATWYFAREAVAKIAAAVLAGEQPRNQIFLSASKRQAMKFRREIVGWVKRVTGVDLKGDPIMLDLSGLVDEEGEALALDPVGLYPLSTNSNTAQGESGDFYFDEFFWTVGFAQLRKVAAAMATHTIYKRTYFSTPSTKTHEAHAFWSGEEWNRGRPKNQQQFFDLSHKALKAGAILPDGSWCQIVTVHDAIAAGMGGLIDVDELRIESSEDEFRNLYECEFVDDAASSFPWAMLRPAMVDSFYSWRDFHPAHVEVPGLRPFADKPVWLGYDPNKQGRDDAALAIIAPPDRPGVGKFRILDKYKLNGLDYQGQADRIRALAKVYNVTDIAIDVTGGHGQAVFELVKRWFPQARKIEYSLASKAAMVIKAQNLFRSGRVEFDQGWTDVLQAFMAIKPTLTPSGKGVTYTSPRNGVIGHADIAWACMHAFSNEPLDVEALATGAGAGFVVVSE